MSRLGFRQRYRPSVVSIPGRANLCYRVFGTPAPRSKNHDCRRYEIDRARWQDGALIVETSNFTENAVGVTNGLPSSTEKHLGERFALNADGQSLLYSFELTDPVYLAAPLRGELRWLYRPNLDVELVPCDPEATRSFLEKTNRASNPPFLIC